MSFFSDLGGSLFGGAGTSAAGSMSGMAGGLAGSANLLRRDYSDYYRDLVQRIPGQTEIPLSTYANEAANNVNQSFDTAQGAAERNMGRMGVNPNSGRWQGLMASLSRSQAAKRADAMTQARSQGRLENFGRMNQAAGLGLQMMGMGNSSLAQAAGLTGQAGYLGIAGQDQQYGRLNDMMQAAGTAAVGGMTGGMSGMLSSLFPV